MTVNTAVHFRIVRMRVQLVLERQVRMSTRKPSFAIIQIFILIFFILCTVRVSSTSENKSLLGSGCKVNRSTATSCFCGLVALPFLLVTVVVYSIIPKFRNIHGTTLRCYLCCLVGGHIGSIVQGILASHKNSITFCLCLGFTIYFSYVASFMWLNVICVDMWWRFSGFGSLRSSGTQHDRKKLIYYSIYAWGVAVLLTAILVGMELIPGVPNSLIRPGLRTFALEGSGVCWISSTAGWIVYLIVPIGVTIVCNICLFFHTFITLLMHNRNAQRYLENTENSEGNQKWFILFVKFFIVMGIGWSTYLIPVFWKFSNPVSYVLAMINCALPGILISVVLICKKDVWKSLKESFSNKKKPLA